MRIYDAPEVFFIVFTLSLEEINIFKKKSIFFNFNFLSRNNSIYTTK